MVAKRIFLLLSFVCYALCSVSQSSREAERVIERFAGKELPVGVKVSLRKHGDCDVFETTVQNGRLDIKASSGVAACRAFYDYVKRHRLGINSWSGNRLSWPASLDDEETRRVASPFANHYYFNVVTFGYTMPYWDWARWEREIDWMALHGVDMPLALVANEAISARVWRKLGLTDDEISSYFVGPAHLPWMRMGNISGIDGPLTASWHKSQVELQHKILRRMRALGMKPICPGFAGFVPPALQRIYPDVRLEETSWCGGAFHNWMLSPEHPLFHRIGKMFVEEWEKEFGRCDYYIVDSFNEMDNPFPPKGTAERYELLARYGSEVYGAIKAGNPDAVWVMQGWMLGYQRDKWDYETLKALLSRVPDDKMLILDLAVDYNKCFWKSETNWDYYKGLFGKQWIYSVIPNMGGKTGMTGELDFYANGRLEALHFPNKGRLCGYGMAPEGIENNEVIYEILTDAGWSGDSIDVPAWLADYSSCRYGKDSRDLRAYWRGMLASVYGSFTDHPRFNWQFRPGTVRQGSINANGAFFAGIDSLAQAAGDLKGSPLYVADLIEMTAQYVGAKMEILVQAIDFAYQTNDLAKVRELEQEFTALAIGADRLLCSHPTLRLEHWLDMARHAGTTDGEKKAFERNARRIVTVWGPPVDDYSARIWSGLIRDYYLPRWQHYFESRREGTPFDFPVWELNWVEKQHGLSVSQPEPDVTAACLRLLQRAGRVSKDLLKDMDGKQLGSWMPADLNEGEWVELTWRVPVSLLRELGGVLFQYTNGQNKLEIAEVSLEVDGKVVCRTVQSGETGISNRNNRYTLNVPSVVGGNNACLLRAKVRSDGTGDSYGRVLMVKKL